MGGTYYTRRPAPSGGPIPRWRASRRPRSETRVPDRERQSRLLRRGSICTSTSGGGTGPARAPGSGPLEAPGSRSRRRRCRRSSAPRREQPARGIALGPAWTPPRQDPGRARGGSRYKVAELHAVGAGQVEDDDGVLRATGVHAGPRGPRCCAACRRRTDGRRELLPGRGRSRTAGFADTRRYRPVLGAAGPRSRAAARSQKQRVSFPQYEFALLVSCHRIWGLCLTESMAAVHPNRPSSSTEVDGAGSCSDRSSVVTIAAQVIADRIAVKRKRASLRRAFDLALLGTFILGFFVDEFNSPDESPRLAAPIVRRLPSQSFSLPGDLVLVDV